MFQVIVLDLLHNEVPSNKFGDILSEQIKYFRRLKNSLFSFCRHAVTSSMMTSEPVPLAAIQAQALTSPLSCFIDEVVDFDTSTTAKLQESVLLGHFQGGGFLHH